MADLVRQRFPREEMDSADDALGRGAPMYGRRRVWAGDTFGLVTLTPGSVAVSWGSTVSSKHSEIYGTVASGLPT
jgi:hypothetical protein